MISFDVHVSGRQVGHAIANDPEEAAYAFVEIMKVAHRDFGEEVAEHLSTTECTEVAQLLRRLADQIHQSATAS